ncbi:MAG: type IV pilin-like G/H family protein [Oscillatoria sp. PMC 1051.18]|nr:type IV pilin-like G/H family protein [Oscillatoria sp. PMC 1050.18]MEC5032658.1 type IV pilin-like G/H family protein [Oscillatoria sp. PMC 1051.18]
MGNFKNAIARMGATAAIVLTIASCDNLQGNNEEALQDFVGIWQLTSVRRGTETDTPRGGGIQLESSDGRLIGLVLPPGGVIELDTTGSNDNLEGNIWLFGIEERGVKIPVTADIAEDDEQLTINMKTTEVDTTSLPAPLQAQFAEDITLIAQKRDTAQALQPSQGAEQAAQSEPIQYIATLIQAQQAYYAANNSFSSNIEELGLGLSSETETYAYNIARLGETGVQQTAIPKQSGLRSYTGGVFIAPGQENQATTTITVVCESEEPSQTAPPPLELVAGQPQCPSGFRPLR